MNLAEQVYQAIKPLPEAMVQEVLDFALFLRQREEKAEWQNLMFAQNSSLADWDNDEDEVYAGDIIAPERWFTVFSLENALCRVFGKLALTAEEGKQQ